MEAVLLRCTLILEKLDRRLGDNDATGEYELEWKKISLVVDRILLLIFFMAMTVASLAILTSSPHIYTTSLSDLRKAGTLNETIDPEHSVAYDYQKPCVLGHVDNNLH